MKTLEAFQKAKEGNVIRNMKFECEIECTLDNRFLECKKGNYDFNYMNLDDDWEVVEKKKSYNIRVYDKNDALINSYNDEVEESKIKTYVERVLESYFGYQEYKETYIHGGNNFYFYPIIPNKGKVMAEPIKTNKN